MAATTTTTTNTAPVAQPQLGRVLVIGGCGFLGHHVVNLLLRDWKCDAVSVVDIRCQRNRRPASDGVEYVEADITDGEGLVEVFGTLRPDVVIHTASPVAQGGGATDELFRKVNVEGTRAVIDACRRSGVKALVYTSSASVLSDNRSDLINANEEYPVIRGKKQTEYYSETKAHAEQLVLEANRTEAPPSSSSSPSPGLFLTTAIRPSGIFGEGDVQLVRHAIMAFREGKDKVQVGTNENLFDFTYVENVAHAHLLAARALLVTHAAASGILQPLDYERVDGEAFLVTNGSPVYFWDMMRAIWRAAGSPRGTDHVWLMSRDVGILLGFLSEVAFALLRKEPTFNRQRIIYSSMTRYYDISKARRRLGYEPLVSLSDGVKKTVAWTLEQEKLAAAPAKS
ncbi:3-beta hydroxysteroid dehydrogenase/isomerase family-domain-containing protein [Biscogniauxia marginata]|nr:3-beta hydroxysteroid dehydrogenase/isomerase family-domain-containing protein [Biscogniauxia marginata]